MCVFKHLSTPHRNKGLNPDWPPNKKSTVGPKFASVVDDQMPMSKWLLQNFNNFQEWAMGLQTCSQTEW
jgi:hypothetical protein